MHKSKDDFTNAKEVERIVFLSLVTIMRKIFFLKTRKS
jgi:hypothetical protein